MMGGNQTCHLQALLLLWSTSGTWEVRRGGGASPEVEAWNEPQSFPTSSPWKQRKWGWPRCFDQSLHVKVTLGNPAPAGNSQGGPGCLLCRWGKLGKNPSQIWNKWPYCSEHCDVTSLRLRQGWLESDRKHAGGGVKLRDPVCWRCRQRGKHSKRHLFSGAAIGLGLGLLQRYDLHLENKKYTCLRFSYLHLCYTT